MTLVRRLWHGQAPAGSLRLQGDRHADSGGTAATGVYFVRAEIGSRILNAKVLLLH